MGQELQIPDSFKNRQMSSAFQQSLNATDDNLAEGIGQSYAVIGYKGKIWSLRHRGERKVIIRPDDGTPSGYLDVIVLGQAKAKSKSFYKKYDPNTSDGDRPICASMDGVVPDLDVASKQCESCVLCPRNVWKTDPVTGRKGRECTDYKRLAVLILPTQTKPILGQPLMEPCFLRVPPDSLNSLAIMGETMAAQGYHYSSYITRITFDPQKAHPCMVFRPLQGLTDAEAPVILDLRVDPTVGRITGGDIAAAGLHAVNNALAAPGTVASGLGAGASHTVSQTVPQPQPATPPPQPQAQPVQHVPASSGLVQASAGQANGSAIGAGVQPATPAQNTSAPATTGLVDTGFGGVSTASDNAPPLPGLQTAADVGEAEASDDELDARIAGLLTTRGG